MSSFVNTHVIGENRDYAPTGASFKDENEKRQKMRWTRRTQKCKQRRRTQWRIPIMKQKWRKSQEQNQPCRYKVGALLIKHLFFFFFAGDHPRIILQKISENTPYTCSSDGPCETKKGRHTFFEEQNKLSRNEPVAFEIQVGHLACVISNRIDHPMFQRRGDIKSFELLSNTQRYLSNQPSDKTNDQIQNKKVNKTRERSKLDNCMQYNCPGTFSGWPLVQ